VNALEPGSALGGYRILARLRAGAMGVLYLARRDGTAGFSRPVAIKVIHDHLAQNKRFAQMFIDEAKLSARIDDPNVVRVEEFGRADGRYYLVMEYVHGPSLAQAISVLRGRGGIPVDHAVAMGMQIAGGLHGAHEATDENGAPLAIVHRDVSPHNIIVSYKGYVRIIDFGIAKARQVGGETKTGSLRGKLAYMPPEQARSARTVDRRADIFAAGLIIWEMLTMRRVFDADTEIAILDQIRNPQIIPPSKLVPGVPKALDELLIRTMSVDPDARPSTGAELQRALGEAVPAALKILSSDVAALMAKVRMVASATDKKSDPEGHGEEVRRSVTIFGRTMHDSVEAADEAATRQVDEASDAPPAGADRPSSQPPSAGHRAATRAEPGAPGPTTRPPPPALRPGDGVRPVAPMAPPVAPPPPSYHQAPPPSHAPHAAHANGGMGEGPRPPGSHSHGPHPSSIGIGAMSASLPRADAMTAAGTGSSPAEEKKRSAAAVAMPFLAGVACCLGVGAVIFIMSPRDPRPAPTAGVSVLAATSAPPTAEPKPAPAPIIIAPPEPVEDPAPQVSASASAGKRLTGRETGDPLVLMMQPDGGPARARRIYEDRGLDRLSVEELKLLIAICKKEKDAVCVSRTTAVLDKR